MVRSRSSQSRAFLVTDVLVGLFIIAILAAVLAVTLGKQRKSVTRFGDSREAIHLAERTLVDLQSGRQSPGSTDETSVSVQTSNDGSSGSHQWVEVTATVRGRSETLVGLIPRQEGAP